MSNEEERDTEERELSRVNVTMSDELKNWYKNESYTMGISMSSYMMIILKQFKDNQDNINKSLQMIDFAEKNK